MIHADNWQFGVSPKAAGLARWGNQSRVKAKPVPGPELPGVRGPLSALQWTCQPKRGSALGAARKTLLQSKALLENAFVRTDASGQQRVLHLADRTDRLRPTVGADRIMRHHAAREKSNGNRRIRDLRIREHRRHPFAQPFCAHQRFGLKRPGKSNAALFAVLDMANRSGGSASITRQSDR
jgi:hypothetical protein